LVVFCIPLYRFQVFLIGIAFIAKSLPRATLYSLSLNEWMLISMMWIDNMWNLFSFQKMGRAKSYSSVSSEYETQ
jgi:hypothetical protein